MNHKHTSAHKTLTRRTLLKDAIGTLTAASTASLTIPGCRKSARQSKRPNVIFVSMDTVRRDHCSVYGYEKNTTPQLSSFAQSATSFDLAYSPASSTGPSHATFFTSLHPIAHGVKKNGFILDAEFTTIAKILQNNGYQTAAVIGSFVLKSKFGYANGFEFYDEDFDPKEAKRPYLKEWADMLIDATFDRRAQFVTNRSVNWIKNKANPAAPFFLFIHYFDAHDPYMPVEPFRASFAPTNPIATLDKGIGEYDAEIAYIDNSIGKLLEAIRNMRLEENTLIVIASDHGEGLMQHNHMYHGVNIYEELVRVPFLIRLPSRIPKGHIVTTPVGLVDLAPTILEMIGIDPADYPFQGRSFAESIFHKNPQTPRPIYLYRRDYKEGVVCSTYVKGEKFGLHIDKWKYIDGPDENTKELFDLEQDPGELNNIYAFFPDQANSLAEKLERWRKDFTSTKPAQTVIQPEDIEKLKSLGYVE